MYIYIYTLYYINVYICIYLYIDVLYIATVAIYI